MNKKKFSEAMGEIDSRYIEKAMNYQPERKKRHVSRAWASAAVIAVVLLSSFTVAMAANEEFRNAVFSFFKIKTPDVVIPVENEPELSGEIENIGDTTLEDKVNVEYIRIDGKFDYAKGVVYLYDENSAVTAYTVEDGQLSQLEPHSESLEYVWKDISYAIGFDWYEKDGIIYANAKDYSMETSAAWDVAAIEGNSDFVAVTLSYGQQIEYTQYPLLYNLKTKKAIAILDGCEELKSRQITQTKLAPDLSGVIVTCDFGNDVYYYSITEKMLSSLGDLCGMDVVSAWFADNDTLCCISRDENKRYTCRTVTLSTGDYTEIFTAVPELEQSLKGGISLNEGRYGLFVDKDCSTYVYDFKTGERALVEGFKYPVNDAFTSLNSSGDKILFARNDASAEGLGVSEIGVLDLEKRSFILFDREGYEARREDSIGWFDNDTVAIWASTERFGYLYLFTTEVTNLTEKKSEIAEQVYSVISEAEKVRYNISNYKLEIVKEDGNRADCLFLADWKRIREVEDDPFIQGMRQAAETLSDEQEKAYAEEVIDGWIVEMESWPETEWIETPIVVMMDDRDEWTLYYPHVEEGKEMLVLLDEYARANWTEDSETRRQLGIDTINEAIRSTFGD